MSKFKYFIRYLLYAIFLVFTFKVVNILIVDESGLLTAIRRMTAAQCGNYIIFLSLRFYVKSKLANLESQNRPFKHI